MNTPRPTLEGSVLLLTTLLETAYAAHIRRMIALRQGRTSRVDDYDLERMLEQIVPDVLSESEGVDGQLTWLLGVLKVYEQRAVVEASVLREVPGGHQVFQREAFWRRFRARLTLSAAGLEWGGAGTFPQTDRVVVRSFGQRQSVKTGEDSDPQFSRHPCTNLASNRMVNPRGDAHSLARFHPHGLSGGRKGAVIRPVHLFGVAVVHMVDPPFSHRTRGAKAHAEVCPYRKPA